MAHDSRQPSAASAANPHGRYSVLRFTLRQFLIGIAGIALACVALRSASTWWVSAMLGLAFFAMTAALLLVVYRRDAQRAFWIGFAAFGWVYLLLLILGWSIEKNTPVKTSSLFTDRLSRASYDWLFAKATAQVDGGYGGYGGGGYGGYSGGGYPAPGYPGGYPPGPRGRMPGGYMPGGDMGSGGYGSMMPAGSGYGGAPSAPAPPFVAPPSKTDFVNVAHGIWAILLAVCGGWLARLIYITQPRHAAAPAA
jgi:hypothetical protein